jgi:GNAT superfamily N-acetyltransferase
MYTIRSAELNDATAISALLREMDWFSYMASETAEATSERIYRHLRLCLADSGHSVYVAEDEAAGLGGYIAVHWLPYLFMAGPEGYISELFLRQGSRGQGLGRQLLEKVKKEAIHRGCYRLSLLNGKHRESYQRAFYEKNGWEERPGMANFVYWLAD